jgi:uncharacterized protein
VRKVRNAVGAWRLSMCIFAHSVIELAAGTVRETETRRGDQLEIEPAEFEPAPPKGEMR